MNKKHFWRTLFCTHLPYSLSKSVIAKAAPKQAPLSRRFTKYGHGLDWTKPVEGLCLEVLTLAIGVAMVRHQAWTGTGIWGEVADGDNEVTTSSLCEGKTI